MMKAIGNVSIFCLTVLFTSSLAAVPVSAASFTPRIGTCTLFKDDFTGFMNYRYSDYGTGNGSFEVVNNTLRVRSATLATLTPQSSAGSFIVGPQVPQNKNQYTTSVELRSFVFKANEGADLTNTTYNARFSLWSPQIFSANLSVTKTAEGNYNIRNTVIGFDGHSLTPVTLHEESLTIIGNPTLTLGFDVNRADGTLQGFVLASAKRYTFNAFVSKRHVDESFALKGSYLTMATSFSNADAEVNPTTEAYFDNLMITTPAQRGVERDVITLKNGKTKIQPREIIFCDSQGVVR